MRVPGITYVQGRNDYPDPDGRKHGIAIHNTSNDASDTAEASYAARRTDGISAHFYVDKDSVTQSIDTEFRCGHAGSYVGNDHSIAVEITGANGKSRAWWLENVAWGKLGAVLAYVIRNDPDYRGFQVRRASVAEMKANPKVKALYGHDDMRRAWGGTTHTDPGPSFPWDRLIQAINDALAAANEEDDMPYDEGQMRAFPWQYMGRGLADNDSSPEGNISTLGALNFVYRGMVTLLASAGVSDEERAVLREQARAGAQQALADGADEIAAAVLAELTPERIAAAIPAELAAAVADELGARLRTA